ncbi:MAG: extracellular solute-binding protein [Planctomycetota bacterium]|nr:extracellular solute-binding protein [Planctomycetota bacterium]
MIFARLSVVVSLSLLACLPAQVVVYVSHDEEHSRRILDLFESESGIEVRATYDTEATKTVGLVQRIIAEASNPVADVFWNNECGQTELLKERGLLQAYRSPVAKTIPAHLKDTEGWWTGFAARSRVLVWNTTMVTEAELPRRLEDLTAPKFKGRIAVAKPLTGTTLTHVAALYTVWGEERTNKWLDGMMANDVLWDSGNGPVADKVGDGVRPFGLTDTDDVNVRRLGNKPVRAFFLDQEDGGLGSFVIPNSVMILKDAPHVDNARKLVDFLLSPRVEKLLAEGEAAQMPLQPGVAVPEHVTPVDELQTMDVDFASVGEALDERTQDLHDRFARVQGGKVIEGETGVAALIWALLALVLAGVFVYLAVKPSGGGASQGS